MKRVIKYLLVLLVLSVSYPAFSQSRSVINTSGTVDIWAQLEQERIAAEKAEQERLAAEKAEQERIAAEKAEQERIAAEKAEQERIAAEKAEQERIAAKKAEQERIAAEKKAEQERIAAEKKAEQERIAAEKKAEQERIAAEKKAEQERIAAEKKAEQERIAAEKKAEQERIAAEKKAEQERIAAEKKAAAKQRYQNYVQNAKIKTLIMGQVGYSFAPQLSYGAMIGQMYKGIGWYISGRSNFNFAPSASFVCDANGMVDGEIPFYSGSTNTTHYIATGGLMINFLEWSTTNKFNTFGLHIGAGYGSREKQWQTIDGQWVKYGPTSHSGVAVNAGIFGSFAGVTLKAGASTIAFKNLEIEAGIGFMF